MKREGDNFRITLKVKGDSSSFTLSIDTVKAEVSRFEKRQEATRKTFKIIQEHVASLEFRSMNSNIDL